MIHALATRIADLRCPACNAVQPLFPPRRKRQRKGQRDAAFVLPCPGCDLPLRLEADPQAQRSQLVLIGLLMVLLAVPLVTVAVLGLPIRMQQAVMGVVAVVGFVLAAVWNGRAARRRVVLRAEPEAPEKRQEIEDAVGTAKGRTEA